MPRGKKTDIFATVRAQADKALRRLQAEIREREGDLQRLIAQADRWRAALLGGPSRGRPASRKGTASSGGKRVDWSKVLASLPHRFTTEDVAKNPDAARKPRNQLYPALTRWEAAKLIKRVGKGTYEKAKPAEKPSRATKAAAKK
jgi:hypothetical protein